MGDIRRPSYGGLNGFLGGSAFLTLVGDVNGPSNANHVDTLTGIAGVVTLASGTKITSAIAAIGDIITAAGTTLTYGSTTPNNIILGSLTRGFVTANSAGLARILVATTESATIGVNARDCFTFFCTTAANAHMEVVNSTSDASAGTGPRVYALAGALKCIGTGGTITTMAAAEPHCPQCGKDFTTEHENQDKGYGYLAVCLSCMADLIEEKFGRQVWIRREKV